MDTTKLIPMAAITGALHDEAIAQIERFSVGITAIDIRTENGKTREVPNQSGTGTLVDLDGTLCIVTADHVIEQIKKFDRVGLIVDWDGGLRRCMFERQHLGFVRLPSGPTEEAGPDLGAIILPPGAEATATLKARKVFYNLRKRIERFAERFPSVQEGVWIPVGVLAEDTRELAPTDAFHVVRAHWAMFGIAAHPEESVCGAHDYIELQARPGVDPDMPLTFGGASGGGLWQARIDKLPDGSLKLIEVVLSGVIFYESAVIDGVRRLRCHGRASVHGPLAQAILAHPS